MCKGIYLFKHIVSDFRANSLLGNGSAVLTYYGTQKAQYTEACHQKPHFYNVWHIAVFDSHVNDFSHNERDQKFKYGLGELKRRP